MAMDMLASLTRQGAKKSDWLNGIYDALSNEDKFSPSLFQERVRQFGETLAAH